MWEGNSWLAFCRCFNGIEVFYIYGGIDFVLVIGDIGYNVFINTIIFLKQN